MKVFVGFERVLYTVTYMYDDIWQVDKFIWHPQVRFHTRFMRGTCREDIYQKFNGDLYLNEPPMNVAALRQAKYSNEDVFLRDHQQILLFNMSIDNECGICMEMGRQMRILCKNFHVVCFACAFKCETCPYCRHEIVCEICECCRHKIVC